MIGSAHAFPSSPFVGLIVGVLLFAVSYPIARRVARVDGDQRLVKLLMLSAALHLLSSPAQIFVVNHFYHGIADYNRYINQGAALAPHFRTGNFSLAGSGVHTILGDGSVSIAAGVVFALVGVNELAGFLVFAWLSFIGAICFYRAFSVTFPEADRRRYALMVFLLPSLLFWTADVSKEAVMSVAVGVGAYGAARILARRPRGYPLLALGTLLGIYVRPNEIALLAGGFTAAMVFRGRDSRRTLRGVRRIFTWAFLAGLLALTAVLTMKFLHHGGSSFNLNTIGKNNSGTGAGFGSSNVSYSSNPLGYPKDVYTVLFDPLPITAHSGTQLLAAGENSIILVLILTSLRRLRILPRVARARPYVLLATLYTLGFMYSFAALGNLGLITRERTLVLPFLLVLLAIPISPKGAPPHYEWEVRRSKRRRQQQAPPVARSRYGARV